VSGKALRQPQDCLVLVWFCCLVCFSTPVTVWELSIFTHPAWVWLNAHVETCNEHFKTPQEQSPEQPRHFGTKWWGCWDLNPGSRTPQARILNHARRQPLVLDTCFLILGRVNNTVNKLKGSGFGWGLRNGLLWFTLRFLLFVLLAKV
jgi:hypothetical protein